VVALTVAALFPAPRAAAAEDTEDPFRDVTLELGYVDHPNRGPMSQVLMDGIEGLWFAVADQAARHGLTRFPRTRAFLFVDRDTAARVFDRKLARFPGLARPGRFAVVHLRPDRFRKDNINPIVVLSAHESTHIVQYAVGEDVPSSRCIDEGAAEWFSWQALDALGRLGSRDRDRRWLWTLGVDDIEPVMDVGTLDGWIRNLDAHPTALYPACAAAFSLLMETGGGPDAYFDYLAARRTRPWRSAFAVSFDEPYDVFVARLVRYAETDGEDFRLPREVAFDAFKARYVDGCAGRLLCIR